MYSTSSRKIALALVSTAVVMFGFMTIDATAGSSDHQARQQSQAAKHRHSRAEAVQRIRDVSIYNSVAPARAVNEVVNPTDYQRGGTN